MAEFVPVIEVPMNVVSLDDRDSFEANLRSLLRHELAAFIVQSQVDGAHARHRGALLTGIRALHPAAPPICGGWALPKPDQGPIGTLHHDMHEGAAWSPCDVATLPAIHTTRTGGGDVRVAHIGADPLAAYHYNDGARPLASTDPGHPHNALLRGFVDPAIVSPRMYIGRVVPGRSVISSGDSGRFAAWHRYDTDPGLGYRTAEISDVMTEYQYSPPRGYDL